MHVPIVSLRHTAVLEADAHHFAAFLSLSEHANQALQVEVVVLAAQADAGDLDGQVSSSNDGGVPAAVDLVA